LPCAASPAGSSDSDGTVETRTIPQTLQAIDLFTHDRDLLAKKILLTGAVPWERMNDLYLAADLFASASLSEVHPMTLLEAGACGLPAVVRRDDAYQGLVEDGYNGYLADSDEQLAQTVSRILPDKEKLQRLSRNAQRLAVGLTIEAQATRLEALYQQLLYPSPTGTQPRARSTARCHPA